MSAEDKYHAEEAPRRGEEEVVTATETARVTLGKILVDFAETGYFPEVDRSLVRDALVKCGANFEPVKDKKIRGSLGQPTNKYRKPAMLAIWGPKFDEYEAWVGEYADEYEQKTGMPLPTLHRTEGESSSSNTSGMIAFLGELTQLAGLSDSDKPSRGDISERLGARRHNGIMATIGKLEEEGIKVELSSKEGPKRPGSFPPGFPIEAWEWLNSPRDQEKLTT